MPYVPSFFFRALPVFTFFIKCGTTQNQPQQDGISKNEILTFPEFFVPKLSKNVLRKQAATEAILRKHFQEHHQAATFIFRQNLAPLFS